MNDQTARLSRLTRIIRWIARGWTIASIGFVLLILIGEILFPHTEASFRLRDVILFVFFPIGTFAGMILAWRWELLGGALTVASMAGFYLALRIMDDRFPRGPYFLLIAAPGFLFLSAWAMTMVQQKRGSPS
ncbi:MAG: hypothetical protein GTO63_29025 [Anaerolineae bacterium]|nr:hypothetical protein [Anaerolineae bacterium]NIN98784.1 hypothetical protein [Anaerolineae bacterium]NIQ81699.1 hypothetical protein [Anaerolineae bacterium]